MLVVFSFFPDIYETLPRAMRKIASAECRQSVGSGIYTTDFVGRSQTAYAWACTVYTGSIIKDGN